MEENSRVKSFDLDSISLEPADYNSSQTGNAIEFVATFPNVIINTGDAYRACVLTLNTMDQHCEEGHNSLAKRPEFVDTSLDKHVKMSETGKRGKLKVS